MQWLSNILYSSVQLYSHGPFPLNQWSEPRVWVRGLYKLGFNLLSCLEENIAYRNWMMELLISLKWEPFSSADGRCEIVLMARHVYPAKEREGLARLHFAKISCVRPLSMILVYITNRPLTTVLVLCNLPTTDVQDGIS